MISLIACMDEQNGIGFNNDLPWHLPEDLRQFKRITSGHPIVMGRKTFESIGKALPNRSNIILTTDKTFYIPEPCFSYNTIREFLDSDWIEEEEQEIFVIGGASIYQQFLPIADRLYLTKIHHTFECDAFFPAFSEVIWKEVEKKEGEKCSDYKYDFYKYERRVKGGKSSVGQRVIMHDVDGNEVVGTIVYSRKAYYEKPFFLEIENKR
jgi:dihydrofolate reductase